MQKPALSQNLNLSKNFPLLFYLTMLLQKYWDLFLLLFTKTWPITENEYASMPPVFHLDNFDNCMNYGENALYCAGSNQLYPKSSTNASDVWKTIQKISLKQYYKHDLLRHSICVTERCPDIPKNGILNSEPKAIKQLEECYGKNFEKEDLKLEITRIECETSNSPYPINTVDVLIGIFLLTIIGLVLFAWIYDQIYSPDLTNPTTFFLKYISAFSLSRNWKRLIKIDLSDPDMKALSCIQGVRFINTAAVIISHSMTINMAVPILNTRYTEMFPENQLNQFYGMGSRYNQIQLFFVTSSWLLAYKFCKDSRKQDTLTFSYLFRTFQIRYLRLVPFMAVMISFFATWMPHLSRGPLWDLVVGNEYRLCRKNWWTNFLFINNFYPFHEMCASQSWSLAIDMQYYILALFLLWFMYSYPIKIFCLAFIIWVFHLIQTAFTVREYKNVYPEAQFNTTLVNMAESINIIKDTAANLPGVLAGVAYGFIFFKTRNTKLFTTRNHIILWWIVTWTTMSAPFFAPGIIINFFRRNLPIYLFYSCFSRSVFSFGVGLFILGMTQGLGGIIKDFCEWRPCYILGRLTYAAYLIHPFIQRLKVGVGRTPNYINDYLLVYDALGYTAWAFLVAVPLTLFFEMPFEEIRFRMSKRHINQKNKKMN